MFPAFRPRARSPISKRWSSTTCRHISSSSAAAMSVSNFAQAYRRFGSRVTIIQQASQLLSQEDPDVSAEIQRILSDEGIECLVSAQTLRVQGRSGKD